MAEPNKNEALDADASSQILPPMNYAYLQIRPLRTLEEVGGWDRRWEMGIQVAVLYFPQPARFVISTEEELSQFLEQLNACKVLVGYNLMAFDLELLRAYGKITLEPGQCLDLMRAIASVTQQRLSLHDLCLGMFGSCGKAEAATYDQRFRLGQELLPANECCNDALALKAIHDYGMKQGCIKYADSQGKVRTAKVRWYH